MIKKRVLAELEKCYSIAPLIYQNKFHILVAAEKKNRCILFDQDGNEKATVWEGPGGVMTYGSGSGNGWTVFSNSQILFSKRFERSENHCCDSRSKWKMEDQYIGGITFCT